jgi:hypothetical protein
MNLCWQYKFDMRIAGITTECLNIFLFPVSFPQINNLPYTGVFQYAKYDEVLSSKAADIGVR